MQGFNHLKVLRCTLGRVVNVRERKYNEILSLMTSMAVGDNNVMAIFIAAQFVLTLIYIFSVTIRSVHLSDNILTVPRIPFSVSEWPLENDGKSIHLQM